MLKLGIGYFGKFEVISPRRLKACKVLVSFASDFACFLIFHIHFVFGKRIHTRKMRSFKGHGKGSLMKAL